MTESLNLETMNSHSATELVATIVEARRSSASCLTCSFQAEDMIVLHLLRNCTPGIPVLFLETGYHFTETYAFRLQIAAEWKLNLVNVLPKRTVAQQETELGILYREDPAWCCQLRKVEPLMESLEPFEIGLPDCGASSRQHERTSRR
jgi:phosphoadenosine phosphosulfate reductase